MGTVPPFRELIATATTSAVHLESRDVYTPSDPLYQDWLAGGHVPVPMLPEWHELVSFHAARGVRFRRARIVSEPLSDYIRYEHYITDESNVADGEEIRWLPRKRAGGLLVPANDFWVLDGRLVRFGYFAGDGEFVEHELTDAPEIAAACSEAFERVWEIATPHADYRPA